MTSPQLTIRRLDPGRAVVYRAMMLEAYTLHPEAFTSSVEERADLPLSWWQERLDEAPDAMQVVLGAFQEEVLCGAAGILFAARAKERHKAALFGMYVASRCRRLGVGRRLVASALAGARARDGVRLLQLTVTQGNAAALALYESFGFSTFGVEPDAVVVGGRFFDKVHMWRNLVSGDEADPTGLAEGDRTNLKAA